jgi:hypothetical protein
MMMPAMPGMASRDLMHGRGASIGVGGAADMKGWDPGRLSGLNGRERQVIDLGTAHDDRRGLGHLGSGLRQID